MTLREAILSSVLLLSSSIIVIFFGWGIGTGDVQTGQSDYGPLHPGHPLVGTIIEWTGFIALLAVVPIVIWMIGKALRQSGTDDQTEANWD